MTKSEPYGSPFVVVAVVAAIVPILMLLVPNVYASTNDTDDINKPLYRQIQDLIVNPNFAPDYTCLFDAYQLHCIQGEDQDCYDIEGFGNNEDDRCFPMSMGEWKCPEGYHGTDDDESGQCYPNDEGCEYDDYVLLTDRPDGRHDRCAYLGYICQEGGENSDHPECKDFLEK